MTGLDSSPATAADSLEGMIGLREAAEQLDVHYMTAYKYVRTGRLAAVKQGGRWWVNQQELREIIEASATAPLAPRQRGDLVEPLLARLTSSDYTGAWQLVEGALASGATKPSVYQDLLSPAMTLIGERWHAGDLSIADEHRATATVQRLIGRMSSMALPTGRRRGTVVVGVVDGDAHGLPSAMLADMLECEHLSVIDLGASTPLPSFLEVAASVGDLVGIGVVVTIESRLGLAAQSARQLKRQFPNALIVLGGGALAGAEGRYAASADVVTSTAPAAVAAFVDRSLQQSPSATTLLAAPARTK